MPPTDRRPPHVIATAVGLVWGIAGYALLWGHTSIVIQRSFVVNPLGTILLLPVRLVLWGIHAVERVAGGPFDFANNNWWIGVVAAAVGAAIALVVTLVVSAAVRGVRRSGGESVPEASERL